MIYLMSRWHKTYSFSNSKTKKKLLHMSYSVNKKMGFNMKRTFSLSSKEITRPWSMSFWSTKEHFISTLLLIGGFLMRFDRVILVMIFLSIIGCGTREEKRQAAPTPQPPTETQDYLVGKWASYKPEGGKLSSDITINPDYTFVMDNGRNGSIQKYGNQIQFIYSNQATEIYQYFLDDKNLILVNGNVQERFIKSPDSACKQSCPQCQQCPQCPPCPPCPQCPDPTPAPKPAPDPTPAPEPTPAPKPVPQPPPEEPEDPCQRYPYNCHPMPMPMPMPMPIGCVGPYCQPMPPFIPQ